jgi:hypothetical protein
LRLLPSGEQSRRRTSQIHRSSKVVGAAETFELPRKLLALPGHVGDVDDATA